MNVKKRLLLKKANLLMMKTAINIAFVESTALMLRLLMFGSVRLTYFLYFLSFLICKQPSAEVWVPRLYVFGAYCFQRNVNNEVSTCFTGFY